MFTKKTRVLSAVLTVCMLISMLACFVVPATAAPVNYTLYGADEKATETGLKDVSALRDIKNGVVSGVKEYKITDRAGFEKMDELCRANGQFKFIGYTITQANDIDFEWENFHGVSIRGAAAFGGTFDGNGFVIKNLLIVRPNDNYVGLFGHSDNNPGATLKNMGIASGLIVGLNKVGSFFGQFRGAANKEGSMINCWSAATVIGLGSDVGGLIGIAQDLDYTTIENCAFLGTVINPSSVTAGGLIGYSGGGTGKNRIKNNFVHGSVINGKHTTVVYIKDGDNYIDAYSQGSSNVFLRALGNISMGKLGENNYYRKQDGTYSLKEAKEKMNGKTLVGSDKATSATFTTDDGATGVDRVLAASLNGAGLTTGQISGYTVKFVDTEAGYPAIAYFKENASEPTIMRVAHTTDNVGDAMSGSLFGGSDLYKTWYNNRNAYYDDNASEAAKTAAALGNVQIKNAADLFALMALTGNNNGSKFGITGITLANDIDLDTLPFAQVGGKCAVDAFWSAFGGRVAKGFVVNGNHKVIDHWRVHNYKYNSGMYISLFGYVGNMTINDLGMRNAYGEIENVYGSGTLYYSFIGNLLNGSQTATFNNCFVTGTIKADALANNNYGGLLTRANGTPTFNNCWTDTAVILNDKAYGAPILGGNDGAVTPTYNNVHHFANAPLAEYGNSVLGYANTVYTNEAYNPAAYLNSEQYATDMAKAWALTDAEKGYYWKATDNGVTWGDADSAVYQMKVVATKANNKEFVAYGKEGDTVDLLKLLNVAELPANALVAATGNVGTVSGTTFTFGKGNAAFSTDIKLLNTADYDTLADLYADHPEFYGDAVKTKLDAIKAKIDGEGYEQSALDADIKEIVPLFEVTPASVVPVTMNRAAVTLICGEEIAAVATPVGDETYLQVGIYNVDDLIYASQGDAEEWTTAVEGVYNFPAKFSGKQTLNLMADLDLAGVTKFVRIHDLTAAFDGRNHTIKNWNATNIQGFFLYPKKAIKNLRFENCNTTVGGSGAMVVGQYWGSNQAEALLENIIIENCIVSGASTYVGGVVMGEARAITQTMRNITIRNTKLTHTNSVKQTESSGLLVGRVREGGNMVLENILIEGCENDNGNHDGVGLVFGVINHKGLGSESANKVTIDGLILRNNKGANIEAVLGGAWQRVGTTKPNSITLKNALIYNNDTGSAPLIKNHHTSTAAVPTVATNVYTDVADTVYGGVELAAGKLATADFSNNKAVYMANKTAEKVLYKVDAAGNIYFAHKAPENAAAPVKVSFVEGGTEKIAYYTDNTGKLIGADAAAVQAAGECKIADANDAIVSDVAAELAKTFTADAVYSLQKHNLKAVHNANANTHNVICENGCEYLEEAVSCYDGEGYPKVEPATEEAEGYTAHKCGACGYEWISDITHKLVVLKADDKNTVMKGEDFKVDLTIANADLLTELVVGLNFNPDDFEYVSINRPDLVVDTTRLDEGVVLISNPEGAGVTIGNTGVWATVTFLAKEDAVNDGDLEVITTVVDAKMGDEDVTVENHRVNNVVNVSKQVRGDLTGDGVTNTADATVMLRHFAGENLLSEDEKALGDIDRNGTFSIVDVLYLLKTLA